MRRVLLAACSLGFGLGALAPADAGNPCADQPSHRYGLGSGVSVNSTRGEVHYRASGKVAVWDTNLDDCNPRDGTPLDWDGDYDLGVGGGFFGYGPWAEDVRCDYQLNVHPGNVAVHDDVFGTEIAFTVGEDDQAGPLVLQDPVTGAFTCLVDGAITPGDPSTSPAADADDCMTDEFVGIGHACGSGGGDGGYWVFLRGGSFEEAGSGAGARNPPTSGLITAF